MKKQKVLGLPYSGNLGISHLVRVLAICEGLKNTGECDMAISGENHHKELIKSQGFEFIYTPGVKPELITKSMSRFVPRLYTKKMAEYFSKIEEDLLKTQKPDIVVRDNFRDLAGIHAKKQGIFDVFLGQVNVCPYFEFDFVPPNVPKVIANFFERFNKSILNKVGSLEKNIRKSVSKNLFVECRKLGLKVNERSYEGVAPDLTLLCDSESVFELLEKPESYKYIGPLLISHNGGAPDWISDFENDNRRKILISEGSTGKYGKSDFFIKTFKDSGLVVAFHTKNSPKEMPENFYGGNYFNFNSVLPLVDAVVIQGGLGSTYFSLKAGKPILGMANHLEQAANCVTVERLNAGLSLSNGQRNSQTLREQVYRLLIDPVFKEVTTKISEKINNEPDPVETAVKYIKEGFENFRYGKN